MRTVLATLGLGFLGAALTGGVGAAATPLAAGLAGGVAGNLATDLFKHLDRKVCERFLDGWSGIDENHHVVSALRLAQIDALRALTAKFEGSLGKEDDRLADQAGFIFTARVKSFLSEETKVAQARSFSDGSADTEARKVVIALLPDTFDDALAARHDSSERGEAGSAIAQVRSIAETAVLDELRAQCGDSAKRIPTLFENLFLGKEGLPGWFDLFVRDAADKLTHPSSEFAAIWNAEQTALIKAYVEAQNIQSAEIGLQVDRLRIDFAAGILGLVRTLDRVSITAQRIDERTAETHSRVSDAHVAIVGIAGDLAEMKSEIIKHLDVVAGFENLPLNHVRRLPTALVVADYGIIPYDDRRGLRADLLSWALDASNSGPSGRLYAAAGGYGKTRLALEAVTILREEHGWRTGLVPRAALEKTDIRGEQDADARLKRFFDGRGDKGALLVLDYAEGRTAQIERVTKAAIASKGSPIRIMLLARGAGEWWEELHKESREIQLVYDQMPVAAITGDIAPDRRETFFNAAANAFAKQLADAQTSDDLLLSADWEAKPVPAKRLAAPEVGSPLSLAFEAFLHVRGVDPEDSPLAEMAREERRHWARALKIKASDVARISDPRVEAVNRCATFLTLFQGIDSNSADIEVELDRSVLQFALDGFTALGAADIERARNYAAVREAVNKLYRKSSETGDSVQPILPDILGEYVCAEFVASIEGPSFLGRMFSNFVVAQGIWSGLLKPDGTPDTKAMASRASEPAAWEERIRQATPRKAPTVFAVLSRAVKTAESHGLASTYANNLATALIGDNPYTYVAAFPSELVASCLIPNGGMESILRERVLERLPHYVLSNLVNNIPHKTVALRELRAEVLRKLSEASGDSVPPPIQTPRDVPDAIARDIADAQQVLSAQLDAAGEDERRRHESGEYADRLGTALEEVGDIRQALLVAEDAVEKARTFALANESDESQARLAYALNNLGNRLAMAGLNPEAVEAAGEAWLLFKELEDKDRNSYAASWVMATNNLANRYAAVGEDSQALELAQMASAFGKALLSVDRQKYEPDFAMYEANLANRLIKLKRAEEAIPHAKHAVEILTRLSEQAPDEHQPELARVQLAYAISQFEAGHQGQGIEAVDQACEYYRALLDASPRAFADTLVRALHNAASMNKRADRINAALAALNEARAIIRQNARWVRDTTVSALSPLERWIFNAGIE